MDSRFGYPRNEDHPSRSGPEGVPDIPDAGGQGHRTYRHIRQRFASG